MSNDFEISDRDVFVNRSFVNAMILVLLVLRPLRMLDITHAGQTLHKDNET